ncbi:MAG TPA: TIGR02221 family CRISPR-associated protein [Rhodocyclaceae bacterium]|nr:MAG: TIGR02221 family CRISPR-associated protein [Rhodocyclales bacterium CG17_big_fil_post_rev_8_21_14_2_50_68_7]PJA57743.1 MAG: TIGR02221 family CRISPR-associated protein [Rhodocyclales bacterium CG_4_9_14_3_um_filter_68_10]HCX34720.1 TIGR02221 family CRISPR-associated protein [Rhodocyclaceae bacterium]
MSHALVTFLGKGRENPETGYRETTYRFADGTERHTPFFGLALSEHLNPATLVILGTRGSQWGVLVEHLAAQGEEEEARLALLESETRMGVDQALLDRLAPLMSRAVGRKVLPRLIPYGRTEAEQRRILDAIAETVPAGQVSFDLTHGFRHLGMLGLLSAFMLERIRKLTVSGLWYGALDMTEGGITPVLRLDGLAAVKRWVGALDRFDATGDYGVFAPLLVQDGVAHDMAHCLEAAAFHERTFNLADARRKLQTFLPALDDSLPGASGLFQARLRERLAWVTEPDLFAWQRRLAYQYLDRRDFVRSTVFAWEAVVTKECLGRGLDAAKFKEGREPAIEALEAEIQAGEHPDWKRAAYWMLKNLRNALAHGNAPAYEHYRKPLRSAEALHEELERVFKRLLG